MILIIAHNSQSINYHVFGGIIKWEACCINRLTCWQDTTNHYKEHRWILLNFSETIAWCFIASLMVICTSELCPGDLQSGKWSHLAGVEERGDDTVARAKILEHTTHWWISIFHQNLICTNFPNIFWEFTTRLTYQLNMQV